MYAQAAFKLSTDKCTTFNPYTKCNDKPVLSSDIIFDPLPSDAPFLELLAISSNADSTEGLEHVFRQLVADVLETEDDVGVLVGKRKTRRAVNALNKQTTRRAKPKKRRKIQKTTAADSEQSCEDDTDISEYEP